MVVALSLKLPPKLRNCSICLLLAAALGSPAARADWKATGPFGGDIEVVRVVPKVPGFVIAAARNGLMFTSANGGASWNNLPFPAEFTGVLHALQVDPRATGTWYAGMEGERPAASGVYKTTDAGRTWTLLPGTVGKAIWSLGFWPADPDVIAAGAADGVYRSGNAGATWSRISPVENLDLRPVVSLAFHPTEKGIIYAGTTHLPWRTGDGGATWQSIHTGMLDDSDVFSIQVDPRKPELVYASACSGVYHSADSAGHWSKFATPPGAFRTYFVAIDPVHEGAIFAGTTEGLLRSEDGGKIWRVVTPHAVKAIAFDPSDAGRIFFASSTGGLLVSTDSGKTLHETNFGFVNRSFTAIAGAGGVLYANTVYEPGSGGVYRTDNFGLRWDHPGKNSDDQTLILSAVPDRPEVLFAAGYRGLRRSIDGGKAWVDIKAPPGAPRVTSLSALGANVVVVAADSGTFRALIGPASGGNQATWQPVSRAPGQTLQRSGNGPIAAFSAHTASISRDLGLAWKACGVPSPSAIWYGLSSSSANNQLALAATSEGLFRSADGCASWIKITEGLQSETASAVLYHPTRGDLAFVSQGGRVFQSSDGGNHWEPINDGNRSGSWPSALLVLTSAPERLFALFPRRGIFSEAIISDGGAPRGFAGTR
jgi:photosystem II stability/assembly factor-like uncharacterized protein